MKVDKRDCSLKRALFKIIFALMIFLKACKLRNAVFHNLTQKVFK